MAWDSEAEGRPGECLEDCGPVSVPLAGLPPARWGPGNEGWPGDRGPYTRLTFLLGLQRGLWHLLMPG